MEENRFYDAHESFTDLDLADAGKTASTAAGSAAIVAKAVHPGPTSLSLELQFWKYESLLSLDFNLKC